MIARCAESEAGTKRLPGKGEAREDGVVVLIVDGHAHRRGHGRGSHAGREGEFHNLVLPLARKRQFSCRKRDGAKLSRGEREMER